MRFVSGLYRFVIVFVIVIVNGKDEGDVETS